jgi:hypothetical protein
VPGILAVTTRKGKKQVSEKSGGTQVNENKNYTRSPSAADVSVELSHSSLTHQLLIAILALAYEEC